MPSIISAGTTAGTAIAISGDTTGNLAFQTNGTTTAMTIDTSQNVGIGTTSPASKLSVTGSVGSDVARFSDNVNYTLAIRQVSGQNRGLITGTAGSSLGLGTNNTEQVIIDTSGNMGIGATPAGTPRLSLRNNSLTSTSRASNVLCSLATFGNGADGAFAITDSIANNTWIGQNNGGAYIFCNVNGVRLPSGGTSWTSDSDERLKDIIEPITDATNKVTSLRAVIGKYKTDEEGTRRVFLIAQDVQKVLPEAVYVQKDEIGTLGLSYTDVIPLLVESIKELKAELDATKAEVQALKGA